MSPKSGTTLPQNAVGSTEVLSASTKVKSGAEIEVERQQDHLDIPPARAEEGQPTLNTTLEKTPRVSLRLKKRVFLHHNLLVELVCNCR